LALILGLLQIKAIEVVFKQEMRNFDEFTRTTQSLLGQLAPLALLTSNSNNNINVNGPASSASSSLPSQHILQSASNSRAFGSPETLMGTRVGGMILSDLMDNHSSASGNVANESNRIPSTTNDLFEEFDDDEEPDENGILLFMNDKV
jgi:hypothetical protein